MQALDIVLSNRSGLLSILYSCCDLLIHISICIRGNMLRIEENIKIQQYCRLKIIYSTFIMHLTTERYLTGLQWAWLMLVQNGTCEIQQPLSKYSNEPTHIYY